MMNNTENIERQGVYKCASKFEELGFMFREQPIGDYGIDAIIETKDNNYLSGKLIAVQIKSGDSYFSKKKGNNVVFRGDIKHYNYWINHSLSVIIVLYSPSSDRYIWEVINKQTAIKCKNGWKINIPYNQTLENSCEKIRDLANKQSDYERRWNSLVIAKDWMLETLKHDESILEVQEWINKSSGRGTFILKVKEEGEEKILFQREMFGFGIKKYEHVIRELFPWADVEIDKEFYEENMEEDCRCKQEFTDRDLALMLGKKGEELLKYSDTLPKIYPYKNGAGEVDFYRLKLTLNQVGKSFIAMEHFLETGKCYFIDKLTLY